MSKHGRFERQKPKKAVSGKKAALIVAALVLALVIVGIVAAVMIYDSFLGQINQVEVPEIVYTKPNYDETSATAPSEVTEATVEVTEEPTEPPHVASREDYINFLVVGQSARPGEDSRMADTMILLTVNTYEKTLTMHSVLRDTLVERGARFKGKDIGKIKMTTVYNLGSYYTNGDANEKIAGSMELMNIILNNNFGIEVDYNFEVDFDIFIKVIDLMYGVTLNLTQEEADYLNAQDAWVPYEVRPGEFDLDGSGALCYARMRKATGDNDSDVKRTARQRHLIERVIARLKTLSISEVENIVKEVLPMVSTSMSSSEITEMLVTMLKILPELEIRTGGTCPASNDVLTGSMWGEMVDIYGDGQEHSVIRFDVNKNTRYFREITLGEVS